MLARLPRHDPGDLPAILLTAAHQIRITIQNLRPNESGRGHRFTLGLRSDLYFRRGKRVEYAPYTRLNHRLTRTVGAVCWHGHRDFFAACYRLHPNLTFVTKFIRYDSWGDFNLNYPCTWNTEIGSKWESCSYGEACYCYSEYDTWSTHQPDWTEAPCASS